MESVFIRIIFLVICVHACTAQVLVSVSANSEGDIVLTCMVDGAFLEPVQWSTNRTGSNVQIVGGDDFTQFEVLQNNTLIIRSVNATYHGYYFCTHTMTGRSYTARIRVAPILQISRQPLGNGDLLLTCLVNEMTTTPVIWSFIQRGETDSIDLTGGGDSDHVQVLMNNTLIVRNFGRNDVGEYKCRAIHDGLLRVATANVSLAARRDTITFTTYQDLESFNFFITCHVNGVPAMSSDNIFWSYKEDDDGSESILQDGDEDSHIQVLANDTLLIRNYSPDDQGRYYCNVRLADGMLRRRDITVGGSSSCTIANVWLITMVTILTLLLNASQ